MIAITNTSGSLLRAIPDLSGDLDLGLHKTFGWISERGAKARARLRQNEGLKSRADAWLLRCRLEFADKNNWSVKPLAGCSAEKVSAAQWAVEANGQKFFITSEDAERPVIAPPSLVPSGRFEATATILAALALLLVILFGSVQPALEPQKLEEPILVKVAPPEKAVVVQPNQAYQDLKMATQAKPVEQSARNVIKSKMGFLDLLGRRDLKKAVGGAPTSIKDASPGAGAGGNAGSGGELLVGLGEGIHKTTVGNSGVAGLGGVGTKGKGGGAGGYGDVQLSAGQGVKISNVAMGNDVLLEGGLSQAVIQATIAKYLSQVRACYEEGLRNNPALTGLVNTNFEIGAAGDVGNIKMGQSSLGDSGVENCIANRMKTWQFPKPVGGVRVKVNYPFLLRPVRS